MIDTLDYNDAVSHNNSMNELKPITLELTQNDFDLIYTELMARAAQLTFTTADNPSIDQLNSLKAESIAILCKKLSEQAREMYKGE